MTTRIYYTESYCTSFEARVTRCAPADGRFHVELDRTAFYPTSGGQPHDTGRLGSVTVLDVVDAENAVLHVVDAPLTVGDAVAGEVHWARRFDHMQQHTGQHVLSAAFDRLFRVRTESFHLGTASATIDLAREVSAEQIRAAEDESNRIVWEDRPLHIRFAASDDAAALELRKESARTGTLRLIEIEGFDLSACGGTHVARTGAIGVIAVAGWERFRGGTRVEFLCGRRALDRFHLWRDAWAATTRHLSVQPSDMAPAVEKLQSEVKSLQKTIRTQQEQLATHEARALVARAQTVGSRRVLVDALDGWDAAGLKALAVAAIAADQSLATALFSRTEPAVAVIACGAASGVDAAAMLKGLTARVGGRGGGKKDVAQGGGFGPGLDELLREADALLRIG